MNGEPTRGSGALLFWLRGHALAVAIVLVLAVVGVVAAVELGGSDSGDGPTTTAGPLVTVVGTIKQILPNGDFVANDGNADYTIAISSTTKMVDRNGADVTKESLQIAGSVQITGTLIGSTINAQSVLVPTDDQP